jgi:hypothetical protein
MEPKKNPGDEQRERAFSSMEHLAAFLEKSRLADYMDLIQRPHRLAWINFWAGAWRGFGFFFGGLVMLAALAWGLKHVVHHLGGIPWIGDRIQEGVAWLLDVISKKPHTT